MGNRAASPQRFRSSSVRVAEGMVMTEAPFFAASSINRMVPSAGKFSGPCCSWELHLDMPNRVRITMFRTRMGVRMFLYL